MKTANSLQVNLNYIDLINHFWKLNMEHPFTANEIAVYFALLSKWNDLHRKPHFNIGTQTLAAIAGVSVSTVQRAKRVLQCVKLISFSAGDGRRKNTTYIVLFPAKGSQKGGHTDYLSPNKDGQKDGHTDYLSTKKEQKKVVTQTHYISKDIEERDSLLEREEEHSSPLYSSMADVKFICLNQSTQWQESMMKRFGITQYLEMKNWIEKFFDEMEAQGQDKRNLTDTTSHCFRWIKIQLAKDSLKKEAPLSREPIAEKGVDAALEWAKVERRKYA
ncbi:DUF7833 domain-containing protein [Pedobacter sp. PWIIR3]